MINALKNVLPAPIIRYLRLKLSKFNRKYYCPVCQTRLVKFKRLSDDIIDNLLRYQYIQPIFSAETLNILNYSCPSCGASDRDRLYALHLKNRFDAIDKSKKYKFIDFAPFASLSKFIKIHSFLEYRSADFLMEAVDDKIDIMDMHIYKDNSVDIFLCSHVLEHVSDDRKAISELYRILKSGGWGIIMVPILLHLKDIYEDPSVTSEAERWKHFGQGDHLRTYSKEGFKGRLAEGGFRITELGIEYFGADTFEKCGIYPRSVLYIVEKKATQDLNQLNL